MSRRLPILILCMLLLMLALTACDAKLRDELAITSEETQRVRSGSDESIPAIALQTAGHKAEPELPDSFTLAAVGDVLLHQSLINAAEREDGSWDFDPLFQASKEIIAKADLAIFDMEGTLSGPPYSGYPAFSAPEPLADTLKRVGFDVAVTANNHAMDFDVAGMKRTVDVLTQAGLEVIGTRSAEEQPRFILRELNGIKLGLAAFSYESDRVNGLPSLNGVPIPESAQALVDTFPVAVYDAALIEEGKQALIERVDEMKKAGAEVLVFAMHWGDEYAQQEGEAQQIYAQCLADAGVDIVFACGPHVLQPIKSVKSSTGEHELLCFYSMGNFVSNQQFETGGSEGRAQDGLIALAKFSRAADGKVKLEQSGYINTYMYKSYPKGPDLEYTVGYALPLKKALQDLQAFGLEEEREELEAALARGELAMSGNVAAELPLSAYSDFFTP